jgi:hypothetical protein
LRGCIAGGGRVDRGQSTKEVLARSAASTSRRTSSAGFVCAISTARRGTVTVNHVNLTLTATAGDNTARFRDVGTDHARITPDGQLILSITGQVPVDFKGVLKIDPEIGEVLHEPSAAYDTTRVCARLTA